MSIDYLDPFRPPERVERPPERRDTERSREVDRERERPRPEPAREDRAPRDDPQQGNSVDEYA